MTSMMLRFMGLTLSESLSATILPMWTVPFCSSWYWMRFPETDLKRVSLHRFKAPLLKLTR